MGAFVWGSGAPALPTGLCRRGSMCPAWEHGEGAGMQQVYEDLSLAAGHDQVPVLLLGETGSGKEHAARLRGGKS